MRNNDHPIVFFAGNNNSNNNQNSTLYHHPHLSVNASAQLQYLALQQQQQKTRQPLVEAPSPLGSSIASTSRAFHNKPTTSEADVDHHRRLLMSQQFATPSQSNFASENALLHQLLTTNQQQQQPLPPPPSLLSDRASLFHRPPSSASVSSNGSASSTGVIKLNDGYQLNDMPSSRKDMMVMAQEDGEQDSGEVQCSVCHKHFKTLTALNGHMRLHGGYFKMNYLLDSVKQQQQSDEMQRLNKMMADQHHHHHHHSGQDLNLNRDGLLHHHQQQQHNYLAAPHEFHQHQLQQGSKMFDQNLTFGSSERGAKEKATEFAAAGDLQQQHQQRLSPVAKCSRRGSIINWINCIHKAGSNFISRLLLGKCIRM